MAGMTMAGAAVTASSSALAGTATAVSRPSQPPDSAKIWKAAQDFEAVALGEFLKPMFATVDGKKNPFSGGEAEQTWKPMMVDEIAKQIAASGGLGLAGPVHDAMLRMQEGKS